MNSSWKKLAIICGIVTILGLIGGGIYLGTKPTKPPAGPCNIPDTYGFHDYTDHNRDVTCPDKRQKLTIERPGQWMGVFEYRCHCD